MPKSIPKNHAFVFFVDLCQKPGKLGFWHWEAKNRIKFVYFVQNPLFTFVYMLQTQIIFRLPIAIYTDIISSTPVMENPIRIPSGYFSVFKIKLFKCLIIHFSSLVAICHSLIFFKISSLTSSLSSPDFQVKPTPSPSYLGIRCM